MSTVTKVVGVVLLVAAVGGAGYAGAQVAAAAANTVAQGNVPGPGIQGFGPMMSGRGNFGPNDRDFQGGPMMGGRGNFGPDQRGGERGFQRGPMMGGGRGSIFSEYRTEIQQATADALGITVDDLNTAIASGKTPLQIAEEKGLTQEEFQTKLAETMSVVLKKAVADGKITQDQADTILAHIKAGFGPGMMQGKPPTSATPTPEGTPQ